MFKTFRFISLCLVLVFGLLVLNAQPTTFEFFLKSNAYESAGLSFERNDGFCYFLGAREDTLSINGLFDILLLKVSQNGDTITHFEHSPDTSVGVGYLKESGNNFLGIGSYHFNDGSTGGMYNIIFNSDLEILDKKIFKYPSGYYRYLSSATNVLTDKDGNYIRTVSLTEPFDNQGYDAGDICFYKYDTNGDTIGISIFKKVKGQRVSEVCFNADTTEIWLFGSGFRDGVNQWVKFDMDFNLISIEEFYLKANSPFYIKRESANTWVGCGNFTAFDRAQDDEIWVFRMNPKGEILNETILGSPDTTDYPALGRPIGFSSTGDIFIAITNNFVIGLPPPDYPSWVMLTKLDNNFEHVFTRFYNPDDKYYESIDVNVCSDGGVLLSSLRYDSDTDVDPPLDRDAWVLKVDGNGYMTGQDDKPYVKTKNALLYPNPGGDQLRVSCGWPSAVLILYNMSGQAVLKKKLTSLTTTVNTSSLPKGNYAWTITIKENNIIETGKWIKNN